MDVVWGLDGGQARRGDNSLWIGAGGANGAPSGSGQTPPNLNTWLTLAKPLDLTQIKSADIEFWLSLDSEPAADTIFVGVSTDGVNFDGRAWSGDSGQLGLLQDGPGRLPRLSAGLRRLGLHQRCGRRGHLPAASPGPRTPSTKGLA
ncbi:MAG: hypothetical protein R3A10_00355 [Caldilineaceae bacterium]